MLLRGKKISANELNVSAYFFQCMSERGSISMTDQVGNFAHGAEHKSWQKVKQKKDSFVNASNKDSDFSIHIFPSNSFSDTL